MNYYGVGVKFGGRSALRISDKTWKIPLDSILPSV